jgi:hypothetical protein
MKRDPFDGLPFHLAIAAFRSWHKLSQAQCAALIPHLSVRSFEQWEQGSRVPPLWSQGLILNALLLSVWRYNGNTTCDETNSNKDI